LANDFLEKLGAFDRVLLTTHEQPDPDGLGSILGLAWHLQSVGKEFRLVIASPSPPGILGFMDPQGWVACYDPDTFAETAQWPDCWTVVDANEVGRLGPLSNGYSASGATKCCIDHHEQGEGMGTFEFAVTDPSASSTCELVIDALWGQGPDQRSAATMPLPRAQALYAGIFDDTGGFRFSCTTPKVMKTAAMLLEMGVKPDVVNRALYGQATLAKMRLEATTLAKMKTSCGGRLAVTTVSLQDLEPAGATHGDIEGLVSRPMELRTVEVSVLFYEKLNGCVKVSMRSKSRVDVNAVCRLFGGGGHKMASGATVQGPLDAALEATLPTISARMEQDL
jgi:phosphoesterase RecJ-like protein